MGYQVRKGRFAAAFLAAFVVSSSTLGAAEVEYRTVALTGQPAPGTEAGVSFGIFGVPVINARGDLAFFVGLEGNELSEDTDEGMFKEVSGVVELVARAGEDVPGAGPGVLFSGRAFTTHPLDPDDMTAEIPVINNLGDTAFEAFFEGSAVVPGQDRGVLKENSGALQLVSRAGDRAPGAPPEVLFRDFNSILLNNDGDVLFRASLVGTGPSSNVGIWAEHGGTLDLVIRTGDPAPLGDAIFASAGGGRNLVFNDDGETVFAAVIDNHPAAQAIFRASTSGTELVVHDGQRAPGTGPEVRFYGLIVTLPFINSQGDILFGAATQSNPTLPTADGGGIWTQRRDGEVELVMLTDIPAPGVVDARLVGFAFPSLNDRGDTAFRGRLWGHGFPNPLATAGIWKKPFGEPLQAVAVVNKQAPGTDPGTVFSTVGDPVLNRAGQVAFEAEVVGPDDTGEAEAGLWAESTCGELTKIARIGDPLRVGPDDWRTPTDLSLANNVRGAGNADSRRSGFNDAGETVFLARFTDGTEGVLVASFAPDDDCDGVPDALDRCVNEAAGGFDADGDGCRDDAAGLLDLIDGLPADDLPGELEQSLSAMVRSAASTADRGNVCVAIHMLEIFKQHVERQHARGRISDPATETLLAYGSNLIVQYAENLVDSCPADRSANYRTLAVGYNLEADYLNGYTRLTTVYVEIEPSSPLNASQFFSLQLFISYDGFFFGGEELPVITVPLELVNVEFEEGPLAVVSIDLTDQDIQLPFDASLHICTRLRVRGQDENMPPGPETQCEDFGGGFGF